MWFYPPMGTERYIPDYGTFLHSFFAQVVVLAVDGCNCLCSLTSAHVGYSVFIYFPKSLWSVHAYNDKSVHSRKQTHLVTNPSTQSSPPTLLNPRLLPTVCEAQKVRARAARRTHPPKAGQKFWVQTYRKGVDLPLLEKIVALFQFGQDQKNKCCSFRLFPSVPAQ